MHERLNDFFNLRVLLQRLFCEQPFKKFKNIHVAKNILKQAV